MNSSLEYLMQVTYFTPLAIYLYGFYCSMNMGISKYYHRKYKYRLIIATILFFINIAWLVYLGVAD